MRQVSPDHRLDNCARSNSRCVVGDDLFAVAQHGNAVGEHQRLFERMRDEDYRHAALLEIADEVEEVFLLFWSERGRRLVEDDHFGAVEHGARDLDHLLLCRAERSNGRRRGDIEVQ